MGRTNFISGTTITSSWLNKVDSRVCETISLKDFGAVGDGVTDDTMAIQQWLAQANPQTKLFAPAGNYIFKQGLQLPLVSYYSLRGEGRRNTVFTYGGSNTNQDLITIGDGLVSLTGISIGGFSIFSSTAMTGGAAMRLRRIQNGSEVTDLSCGELNGSRNLWDGIWFDNINVCQFVGFELNVANEGFICNGSPSSDEGSDIYLSQGTATFCNVGYHVGGGIGGVYFGAVLAYGCGFNFKVTNDRAARFNRELLWSDLAISDGNFHGGIYVNDPLSSGCNLTINAFIGSSGVLGGAASNNIHIESYPNSRISINSSQIFNARGHGVYINDPTSLVTISSSCQITNNNGYGVFSSSSTENISCLATFQNNLSGNMNPNIREWKASTTTVTASSGTITGGVGYIRAKRLSSLVFLKIQIEISNNGSGAGELLCTLPFVSRETAIISGSATSIAGKMIQGVVLANTNVLRIKNYDGTYPSSSGESIHLSGVIEAYSG